MARRPAVPGVDRREQILEAALDVFAEDGFEGATTKEIAARADVTQGLIYFYFPSKEDLFFAAYKHRAKQAFTHLRLPAADECDEPPEVVIHRAVAEFLEELETPRNLCLMRIMMRVMAQGADRGSGTPLEERRHHIREQTRTISDAFRHYLDAQVARGAVQPVDTALATEVFFGGMMVAVMRRASGEETLAHLSRDELAHQLVDIFLHGLLVPHATAPAASAKA